MTNKLELNKVTFNRKGKGKGGTYVAFVLGTPKLSKKGKFIRLVYKTENIREQQVREICAAANIDVTEALMVGHDVIKRLRASGGSSLADSIIVRLAADEKVIAAMNREKITGDALAVRYRSMASDILGLVRNNRNGKTLDDLYSAYIALNL